LLWLNGTFVSSPTPGRKAFEEVWRLRLRDAKLRLDFARHHLKELLHDFRLNEISTREGNFAYQKAVRDEKLAQRESDRVRRLCRHLIINGVIPNEGEWLKARAASSIEQLGTLLLILMRTAVAQYYVEMRQPSSNPELAQLPWKALL